MYSAENIVAGKLKLIPFVAKFPTANPIAPKK
jgi:hypothetical protein